MKMFTKIILIVVCTFCISFEAESQTKAHSINQKLARGVNLGNCLEAPSEGEWGVTWKAEYFKVMSDLGFNSVRIPTRWEPASRSLAVVPYTISETFFARMDQVIKSALSNKLMAILNMHHHNVLFANPDANLERFKSMWNQIATRYKNVSDSLVFELLNEPNGNLTPVKWNTFLREGIQTIRAISPERTIIIGTANWGGVGGLAELSWPDTDNLILTIHYYNPFQFTHQGATWTGSDTQGWLGTTWNNTEVERSVIESEFQTVKNFSSSKNIPVNIGEFGAFSSADIASRERWTTFCSRFFEKSGFSWNYWEFCSGFGFYNTTNKSFVEPLVRALLSNVMPEPTPVVKNQVYKMDFTGGSTNINVYAQQGGLASGKVVDGAYKVTLTAPGAENWHVQASIINIKYEKGKTYQIEFDAWADAARTIGVTAGMNKDPWTTYSTLNLSLTNQKKPYSLQFRMTSATDNTARLAFELGKNVSAVYLDNIYIYEVVPVSIPIINKGSFAIYPNPVLQQAFIESETAGFNYAIYNMSGCVEMIGESNEFRQLIDLSHIKRGIYMVEIKQLDGARKCRPIIKN